MADGHDMAMALRAAYWGLHRRAEALLRRHGVTADQFVLLSLLADGDGETQQDLVRRAASDSNTVRAMLVLLEGQGLVLRSPHPRDGRARRVALTGKGRRVFSRLWSESEEFRRRLLAIVGADEAGVLVEGLRRIAEAMAPVDAASKAGGRRKRARARG